MKKLLSLIGAISLVASSTATVVACNNTREESIASDLKQAAELRTKGILLGDNYNLNQKELYKTLKSNNDYNDKFISEDSLKNVLNSNGSIGKKGGILDLILGEGFDFSVDNLPDFIKKILPNDQLKNSESGSEKIAIIFDTLAGFLQLILGNSGTFGIFGLLPGLDSIVRGLMPKGELPTLGKDVVDMIRDGFNNFVKNGIPQEAVNPILEGLKVGGDSSLFFSYKENEDDYGSAELEVHHLYAVVINAIINAIGYGINPKDGQTFKGMNVIVSAKANPSNLFVESVDLLSSWINDNSISTFNFSNNPGKIVENITMSVNALNIILSVYRTPEVDLDSPLVGGKDRSEYLFSNTETNDVFVRGIARNKAVIDFEDYENLSAWSKRYYTPVNLKGFNMGELVANINYYLGGSKYHHQKLAYVLLHQGSLPSPLINFSIKLLSKTLNFEQIVKDANEPMLTVEVLNGVVTSVFEKLTNGIANNKNLNLKALSNGQLWDMVAPAIDKNFPGKSEEVAKTLEEIDNVVGDKAFDFLYSGNLNELIDVIKNLVAKFKTDDKNGNEKIDSIIKSIEDVVNSLNDFVGKNPLNLETMLTKISLGEILNIVGVDGFQNPNIPNFGSYYTKKTIQGLAKELGEIFDIGILTTHKKLKDHYLDFSLVQQVVTQLFYSYDGKKTGLVSQIIDSLEEGIDFNFISKLLGYVKNENYNEEEDDNILLSHFVKKDSFIGDLIKLSIPEAKTHFDSETGLLDLSTLPQDAHNNFDWLMLGVLNVLGKVLSAENISDFVNTVINSSAFDITSRKKGNTLFISVNFDPTKVVFADETKLSGDVIEYKFELLLNDQNQKYDFTKITKS